MLRIQPQITTNFSQKNSQPKTPAYSTNIFSNTKTDSISFKSNFFSKISPENTALIKQIKELGLHAMEENIPPVFRLKNGASIDCPNGLKLTGTTFSDDGGILLSRQNDKMSAEFDINEFDFGGNDNFHVKLTQEGKKYLYKFGNFDGKEYSMGRKYLVCSDRIGDLCEEDSTEQELGNVIKKGLNFLLTGKTD